MNDHPSHNPHDDPSDPYQNSSPDATLNNPVGARTDTGCVREHNEDSLIVLPPLYAVADGMGGHFGGEIASEIAIQTLAECADTCLDAESLACAVAQANLAIIKSAEESIARTGMGTTLTAAVLTGTKLLIAQVGDSRAYLLADSHLRQLTVDHSFVAELVASGQITEAEAAVHPKRSMITRALGSYDAANPDIFTIPMDIGNRILICSDGLSGMVSDEDICSILLAYRDPQQATDELIFAAREAGGLDNITAIVIDIAVLTEDPPDNDPETTALSKGKRDARTGPQHKKDARRKKRGARLGIITFLIIFVLLIAAAVGGVYLYASNAAFLRIDNGQLSVYRGLSGEVLPGVRLQWLEYHTDISSDAFTSNLLSRLEDGVQVSSLDEAKTLVADYEDQIARSSRSTGEIS